MPFGNLTEFGPYHVLAVIHQCAPHLRAPLVLDGLESIQPVFHVFSLYDDPGPVPFTDAVRANSHRWNEVIEAGQFPVAVCAQFRIRMDGVVENLVLAADCGSFALVQLGVHGMLDAAVGAPQ